MEQYKENKEELLATIREYGAMPVNPERAAFLANCWAAYNALRMVCGEEDTEAILHKDAAHDDHGEEPLTKDQVMCWVASMENADGTHGGHWTMEETERTRKQWNIDCRPLAFYAAMNMMYSDYCKAAENANVHGVEFYAHMAKAFLDDKDAKPDKLARYYHAVARE